MPAEEEIVSWRQLSAPGVHPGFQLWVHMRCDDERGTLAIAAARLVVARAVPYHPPIAVSSCESQVTVE